MTINNNGSDPFAGTDDADLTIQSVTPQAGETVNVAGAGGWYGAGAGPNSGGKAHKGQMGDTFHTTSGDGYSVDGIDKSGFADSPGIKATPFETGCQRARRLFGLGFETKLVRATRADGGADDVVRYYVVRKDDSSAIGLVGKVAAQRGKGDATPSIVDPAPMMLQPEALDVLDGLETSPLWQGIDRGGLIAGTTPWLQGRPIAKSFPGTGTDSKGVEFNIRPMISNPLDGSGCMFLALILRALACRNDYASILGARRGLIKLRHCKSGEAQLKKLRQALKIMAEDLPKRLAIVQKMASAQITPEWLETEFLPKVLGFKPGTARADMSGKVRNRFDAIMGVGGNAGYYHDAPGAEPGSAWGALQGVTYLTNHHWQGKAGETFAATPTQLFKGGAGAMEARAVAAVQTLTLSKAEKATLARVISV